jgi:hypothetical protein
MIGANGVQHDEDDVRRGRVRRRLVGREVARRPGVDEHRGDHRQRKDRHRQHRLQCLSDLRAEEPEQQDGDHGPAGEQRFRSKRVEESVLA